MPSNEDIKEALGYDRNDPTVIVRQIPFDGLSERLEGGKGFSLDDVMTRMDDILGPNVVEARIPHAGDDPEDEVTAAETSAETPRAETGEERFDRQESAAAAVMDEVFEELERAVQRHGSMHSPHEGYAVIKEELDELWDEVKANHGLTGMARDEALQVAAMAVRYVLDLDPRYTGTI